MNTTHQTPLQQGIEAAHACHDHAEATTPAFDTARAGAAIMERLRASGFPLSGEDLVDHCIAQGIIPHNPKAFGAVFLSLQRAGSIESTGITRRRKGHGAHGVTVWGIK
jgi:hypothetical protein